MTLLEQIEANRHVLNGCVGKSTPTSGTVHVDRPIELLDDPGTQDVDTPPVQPSPIDEGIQDPNDQRNANDEGKKDDDDPGTQDVDPPNQQAVNTGPLDVIIPQDTMGKIEKRISGSSPIKLSPKGRELAQKLAERIKAKGGFDVIYSSTLPRGIETVQPILTACPNTKYAGAQKALVPWKLGVYEGKDPKDVNSQIVWLIKHPDEVPPGEGADGSKGESFNQAKSRQLSFYRKVYEDFTNDPTLKIAIQNHSRGEELLEAWVADDCPDDYDIDTDDVIDPDDQPHASVMRWLKDDVKEVDLDSDEPFKPGVYTVLHSLTKDDGDDGNPELEKYDADQPRDDHGKFGSGGSSDLKSAQGEHDRLKEHPAREQNASETAQNAFVRDVDKFGDRVGRLIQQNTAALMNVSTSAKTSALKAAKNQMQSGRDMLDEAATKQGDERMWRVDTALSAFHSALLITGKVLGSKWVGKSDKHEMRYMPPLEVHRAAKSAWDRGVSFLGVTDCLAESEGLTIEGVDRIAKLFASPEAATMSAVALDAYGGKHAARWANRVLAKAAKKEWPEWIAVDLDGTLAEKLETYGGVRIGKPIAAMVAKVKSLLDAGKSVRIFTARVAHDPDGKQERTIKAWCKEHIGQELPVTNEKDPGMVKLIDDLAEPPSHVAKAGGGVMVALWLDRYAADTIHVADGEDPDDMHVTLAYLGKLNDMDAQKVPDIAKVVKDYAAQYAPLEGEIAGPVRFPACPNTEGRDVCVASFENPGIQEFRAGLVNKLKDIGIEVPRTFSYTPHVCLKYISPADPLPTQKVGPVPVKFGTITLKAGSERTDYPLSGTEVVKYSPDQPRADNGEFGSGGSPKVSDRVERARKSCIIIGTKEQAVADRTEAKLSQALGVPRTKNNSAFDLRNDDVGIEVKTLLSNSNDKITMNKFALGRKLGEAQAEGLKTFTVVADLRGRSTARYYVTPRLGSLRLGGMTRVTLPELRDTVRNT